MGVATVFDAEDDDLVQVVVDPVEDAVRASSSRPDADEVVTKLFADSMGVGHQCGGEEFEHRGGNGFRKSVGDGPLGRWCQDELVFRGGRHERKRRTASTPRTTSPRA